MTLSRFRAPIHLLCIILLLCALPAAAATALAPADLQRAPLGLHAAYFVDETHTLDREGAEALYRAGRFTAGTQPVLSFGFSRDPVWIRLAFHNDTDAPLPLRLIVNSSWLDRLAVHFLQPGQPPLAYQRGDTFPFAQRGNHHLAFSIGHSFAPGTTDIYIHAQTRDALVLPIFLLTPEQAELRGEQQNFSYGFFYGYVGALLIINFVLFFALGDRRHLLYATAMASFLLLNFAYSGHAYRWLWPGQVEVQRWIVAGLIIAYCCSSILFAMHFLETARHMPRSTRLLRWGMGVFSALIVGCALLTGDPQPTYRIAFTFVAFFSISILWLGFVCLRRAVSYSRYFFLATTASMAGSTVTALSVWGAVPYSEWTHRAAEIGMIVDATLLAVALGIALRTLQHRSVDAEQRAARDGLTNLYNRRAFLESAQPIWERADKSPLAVVMVDIDHFKAINDNYGHKAGDAALQAVAKALSQTVRGGDLVSRWGGEEFLLLLPDTDLAAARLLAERLRQVIAAIRVPHERGEIRLTASFGVCNRGTRRSLEQLVHSADQLLYRAKKEGRDRICVEAAAPG